MSIEVDFSISFKKRENSCDVPVPTDWTYRATCELKDSTSIIEPVMMLNRNQFDTAVSTYGGRPIYARITDFDNRYYWITDIVYNNAIAEIHMIVDVLATYKLDISNSKQYILRSTNQYNTYLTDTMYPAQSNVDLLGTPITSPWVKQFNQGCVCFGIVGSGATNYYLMSYNDFSYFVNYLLSDDYTADAIGAFGLSTYPQYKMVVDPLQYLSALTWIPLPLASIAAQTSPSKVCEAVMSIKVGFVNVAFSDVSSPAITGYRVHNAVFRHTWSCQTSGGTYTLYTHTDAPSRGQYLNCAPWTQIQIYYPPFGLVDIDTVNLGLYQAQGTRIVHLQLTTDIDVRTGSATLTVYRFATNPSGGTQVLTSLNSQVGVTFEIGQVISPGYGVASQVMFGAQIASQIAGIGASAALGNMSGAIQGASSGIQTVVSGVGDIIASKIPTARSIGGTGGVDALMESPQVLYQFYSPSDEAIQEVGRLYCKEDYIYNMQGYVLCRDAQGDFGNTLDEKRRIIYYMNTGFFY